MQQRSGAREIGLIVATLGVLVHFVEPAQAAIVAVLMVAAAVLGTAHLLGESRPWRVPLIPSVLPAVAAFATAGAARLVEPVPWLGFVFALGWAATAWAVWLELIPAEMGEDSEPDAAMRPVVGPPIRMRPTRRAEFDLPRIVSEPLDLGPLSPAHPRPVAIRSATLGLSFVAFAAIGGLVPGGMADGSGELGTKALVLTVAFAVVISGLLGYRIAAITRTSRFDRIVRVLAMIQYAVPIGVFAAVLRMVGLPRLFGPALLTLLLYVITVIRDSADPVLENRRLLQELLILGTVGVVAGVWGFLVR
jgi:hypothetical protein